MAEGQGERIDWKLNARKIYDLARAGAEAYCYLGAQRVVVEELGFSHEPVEGSPGEVVKITPLGVEVATGAGLIVLRKLRGAGETGNAPDAFARAKLEVGAVLT